MLSKAEIKRWHALGKARTRAERGLFLAEGVRLVEELLASGIVLKHAFLSTSLEDTLRGAALAARLRDGGFAIDVSNADLNAIAGTDSPQGVVAVAGIPDHTLESLTLPARALFVVLDAVQDPGNFGTIVRSAHAFGARAVIVLPGTVDPWNPKAVRSAAGSSLHVPVIETTFDALRVYCETNDMVMVGAAGEGSDVATIRQHARTALLLGNEGAGLGDDTKAACAGLVAVPIRGGAESLNVGVAAGILLYVLSREL